MDKGEKGKPTAVLGALSAHRRIGGMKGTRVSVARPTSRNRVSGPGPRGKRPKRRRELGKKKGEVSGEGGMPCSKTAAILGGEVGWGCAEAAT